jgi:RNA polymerase sigma-70 factor (ECF subfamily)
MAARDPELAARQRLADLFEAHHAELLAYARRRGMRQPDAEEVVAETFVVAWRRMDKLPDGAERAWLFGISRNVASNQLRTIRRREQRIGPTVETGRTSDETAGLDADLRAILDRLREADRELLELSAWEELSPADLAVLLDITPNAAAIRLHRARRRFVEAMIAHSENVPVVKGSPLVRTLKWAKGLSKNRREIEP